MLPSNQDDSKPASYSFQGRIYGALVAHIGKFCGFHQTQALVQQQEQQKEQKGDENAEISLENEETDTAEELEEDNEKGEDNDEDSHPRCDWKTIDAIPHSRYEELVALTCTFTEGPLKPTKVLAQEKGTFNAVSIVGVITRGKCDKYIVRVPGHATVAHWTAQDAYMMQREIDIIEYIRKNTSAPVPQICTYSTDFANVLGHPFIMMTMLPGKSAFSAWFDEDFEESEDTDFTLNFRFGDLPSPVVEKKRLTLLCSLARIMAEINKLSFNEIGMPNIPIDGSTTTSIGPLYQWDNTGSDAFSERLSLSTTADFVSERPTLRSNKSETQLGMLKLLDMIFSQPVFDAPSSTAETFTLHHADLDLQNILVDEAGNVTGIIDWDRCVAVPRCVGASSAPLFLQKDWMPSYLNNLATAPYMTFTTDRYRQMYAAALAEQGCPDAKYTTKSAMYQAGIMALYDHDGGDTMDFLAKVLRCIPEFRGRVDEVLMAFGLGWPTGEAIVRQHLVKIFESELPDMNILQNAETDIAATDWMLDFQYEV